MDKKQLQYIRKWREKNREKWNKYQKTWRNKNKNKFNEYQRKYRKSDKFIKWIKDYKEKYYKTNKFIDYRRTKQRSKQYNTWKRAYRTKLRKNPKFRLDSNMACLMWYSLKERKAGQSWKKLVNYSLKNLVNHLEKQFDNKMTWNNYGSYWWVDHIKPRASFRYTSPNNPEFKKCWALSNLQPLEKIANIKKGRSE